MRKHTGILFTVLAAALVWTASAAAAPVEVSVSVFHDQLAPHGRWVAAGSYGNCWVPSGVARGWEPYVDGQWVYSDYGWTWVSDDPWGDIPYHYGTWAYADPYGWVWVPGTVWAPAWVTWAYTDDYVGWAPVPPSFALSATGYFGSPVVVTSTHYVFVPTRQFVGVRVATVRVPAQQSVTILPHAVKTTRFDVSQGVVRIAGPPESRVARVVGHPIQHVAANSLRARPTTLAAGGVTATKSVRVVAPETERAKIAAAPARNEPARNAKHQAETRTAQKAEKNPKKPARPAAESSARNESATAHAHGTERAEPKPKARPETETRQANVAHTQQAPKPKAKPKPEHRAEPEKPQATAQSAHEAQPRESAQAEQRAKAEKPQPEAHPQSETRQANAEHSQPAPKPKARPQQKPQPPKEKEKPPSQD